MSRSPRRLSFPSSSQDFALPSGSTPVASPEDSPPLFLRFRRPSLLPRPSTAYADKHTSSPLALSFTLPTRRHRSICGEESESDRERMCTESSPSNSSGNPTPPISLPAPKEAKSIGDQSSRDTLSPSTPPPNQSISVLSPAPLYSPAVVNSRRSTYPLKPPRVLNILAESTRPEDDEVKSEAAFQRLIASYSELPVQPRTPRAPSNKGRYPEEAVDEDFPREDTPSDEDDVDAIFAFDPPSEPATTKPCTPAHSVNGDDPATYAIGSPMVVAMDVDLPLTSPLVTSTPSSVQWRYTPPPTASAVRSNKRKFDDRYDPYPTAAKRRAVSPSISYLREVHASLSYPRTPNGRPSFPNPLAIPVSNSGSANSSPTVTSYNMPIYTGSRQVGLGSMSVSSSPILRPTLGLASPILRPIARNRRGMDGDERDIEGANEGVNGLTLS
ncbi:hypothetical protein F5141DRAFT_1074844 [Pisolithus sp. B1]|nr:hypothetical protein F5141DRAFT_1074844 [Pisolithus sp. B1]